MIRTVAGRYILFGVLGVEALVLPFFLSKEVYGEVEFLKFTAFLVQFSLFGAGSGYVVCYLKDRVGGKQGTASVFLLNSLLHAWVISCFVLIFLPWQMALVSFFAMFTIALESSVKAKEKYLLAMAFKPMFSTLLIICLPFVIHYHWPLQNYLLLSFTCATLIYLVVVLITLGSELRIIDFDFRKSLSDYGGNIKCGFMINISTAMLFSFFYVDRALVRERYPELLGDYSLSYAIMQLTIVAITTFSYVNLVEFGKNNKDLEGLRNCVFQAMKNCLKYYLAIGSLSIIFSLIAEDFYGYDDVFETTILMVGLFGIANVLGSVSAAHIYLGTINRITALMFGIFVLSAVISYFLPTDGKVGYYTLLSKTYGMYLIYTLISFFVIVKKLNSSSACYRGN